MRKGKKTVMLPRALKAFFSAFQIIIIYFLPSHTKSPALCNTLFKLYFIHVAKVMNMDTHIDDKLSFKDIVDFTCKKASQRLFLIGRLKGFEVSPSQQT